MNLKIEDLERNDNKSPNPKKGNKDHEGKSVDFSDITAGNETSISNISVESKNLI